MCEECATGFYRPAKSGRPNGTGGKPKHGSVPVVVFRDRAVAMHDQGRLSWNELAKRMGWTRVRYPSDRPSPKTEGNTTRLKQTLGLRVETVTRRRKTAGGREAIFRYRYYRQNVTPEMARRLMVALEMDPVDAGI